MKIFVSYAFTGEDSTILKKRLEDIRLIFDDMGLDYYMNMFSPNWQSMMDRNATGGEFLQQAFKALEGSDVVLVVMSSSRRSEGMLMEIGASVWLGKPVILAQHESTIGQTYLPTIANKTFIWREELDLLRQIRSVLEAEIEQKSNRNYEERSGDD